MIIKALAKRPDSKWMYALIPRTAESIREFIGGDFKIAPVAPFMSIILNDEEGLHYSCTVFGAELEGNILIVGNDENGITDVDLTLPEAFEIGMIFDE